MKEIKSANSSVNNYKPFLKWAGGKTQLIPELTKYVPRNYEKYIEPFVGAGALFFHLIPDKALISDSNPDLILTYEVVKNNPEELISELKNFTNDEKSYYQVRSWKIAMLSELKRAARIIFLNKTCFNGLYRVNKKEEFNVPFGKRINPTICDEDVIRKASIALKNTTILHCDFEYTLNNFVTKDDFVFLDPPYMPVSQYSDFKRYTKEFFHEEDHLRLKNQFDRIVQIGAKVILTNSDAPYIIELFKNYPIVKVETRRSISSNAKTRNGRDIIVLGI